MKLKHIINGIVCAAAFITLAPSSRVLAVTTGGCSGASIKTNDGAYTLNASCQFAGTPATIPVDIGTKNNNSAAGVDSGATVNTTVFSPGSYTLTVPAGQSFLTGSIDLDNSGAIILQEGAEIILGAGAWMADSDSDQYPDSTSMTVGRSNPGSLAKAITMTDYTVADCAPTDANYKLTTTGSNPIAYFPFNEANGSRWAKNHISGKYGANVYNSSFVAGKYGNAVSLGSTNSFVAPVYDSAASFNYNSAFTLSAWVKTTLSGTFSPVFSKLLHSSPNTGYEFAVSGTGVIYFQMINNYSTSVMLRVSSTATVNDGQWHHIAVTHSGSGTAAGVTLYIDGVSVAKTVVTDALNGQSITNTAHLMIGGRNYFSQTFIGQIDDARIYAYARTPAQITEDHNGYGPTVTQYQGDSDGDGIATSNTSTTSCGPVSGYGFVSLTNGGDCYDSSAYYGKKITGNPPVYQWLMNESSVGSYGLAKDFVGGKNAQNFFWGSNTTGIITNGPTTAYARSFNGSNSILGFENASIKSLPMTLAAWVYLPAAPASYGTVIGTDALSPNYHGAWMNFDSNLAVGMSYGNGGVAGAGSRYTKTSGSGVIPTGRWTHVAAVYSTTTSFTLYVNGMDVGGTYSGTSGITFTSSYSFGSIGAQRMQQVGSGTSTAFLSGYLADVRIYDYARTAAQVREDMDGLGFDVTLYQGDSDGDWAATTSTTTTSCAPLSNYGSRQNDPIDSNINLFRTWSCNKDLDGDGFKNADNTTSTVNTGYGCNISASTTYRTHNWTTDCNDSSYSLTNSCCWKYNNVCDANCKYTGCSSTSIGNRNDCQSGDLCTGFYTLNYENTTGTCSSDGSGLCKKCTSSDSACGDCIQYPCRTASCDSYCTNCGACTWGG